MSVVISPTPALYFPNNNNTGAPAAGFKLFTYVAGTTTKQATWTDSTQVTQNNNPLLLDANGFASASSAAQVWLDPTLVYKFVWAPANDTDPPLSPIRTIDNIRGPIDLAAITQTFIGQLLWPRTAAEISASVTPTNYFYEPGDVRRYGAITNSASWTAAKSQYTAGGVPILQLPMRIEYFGGKADDASFDNKSSFDTAVSICTTLGFTEIFFAGASSTWHFLSAPSAIPVGITLRGESPRAFLERNYSAGSTTEAFMGWDGSGSAGNSGKGGGIENLGLSAGTGTTSGTAIKITGTDTTVRPGFMEFRNSSITGGGQWAFGILISGTNITTSGSQGMRDHHFSNVSVFRCSSAHIQVSNGVHIFFESCSVFDGGLGGTPLINITGAGGSGVDTSNSDEVHFCNLDCEGNLTIQHCSNVTAQGRVTATLTIDSTAVNVAFVGTANTLTNTCTSSAVVDSANGIVTSNGFKLINGSVVTFDSTAVSTSANAGGASALPATPVGYLNIIVGATARRVPYYAT